MEFEISDSNLNRRFPDDYWQAVAGNCHRRRTRGALWAGLVACLMIIAPGCLFGHGGVVVEEDLCVIDIGPFRAHFTIYQPQTRASEEFCEEVPDLGETIFAMDYLHDSLRHVPVGFRIIRDVNDRRSYARLEDIQAIDDLEAATIFFRPPAVEPGGSVSVSHEFSESGWYIGIVTARHPTMDTLYTAVFGFHVGGTGFGYWPWLLLAAGLIQLQYWLSSGGLRRWRARRIAARSNGA